jgi:hypothetical protein
MGLHQIKDKGKLCDYTMISKIKIKNIELSLYAERSVGSNKSENKLMILFLYDKYVCHY